jgi:hypothetical protein
MSANNLAFPIIKKTAEQITAICERIIFTAGPYLKEGIYQDLLVHELRLKKLDPSREMVFNYKFVDSNGNDLIIGNNQFLRSDIELPSLKGILELKSSGAPTKDDNIWQLRNYLEQRPDRNWGLVINFISKFGSRSAPHVQCDLLVKSGKTYSLVTTNEESIITNQYFSDRFYSKNYTELSNILVDFEDKDVESTNEI